MTGSPAKPCQVFFSFMRFFRAWNHTLRSAYERVTEARLPCFNPAGIAPFEARHVLDANAPIVPTEALIQRCSQYAV